MQEVQEDLKVESQDPEIVPEEEKKKKKFRLFKKKNKKEEEPVEEGEGSE
jgi:hypothetical protein